MDDFRMPRQVGARPSASDGQIQKMMREKAIERATLTSLRDELELTRCFLAESLRRIESLGGLPKFGVSQSTVTELRREYRLVFSRGTVHHSVDPAKIVHYVTIDRQEDAHDRPAIVTVGE